MLKYIPLAAKFIRFSLRIPNHLNAAGADTFKAFDWLIFQLPKRARWVNLHIFHPEV